MTHEIERKKEQNFKAHLLLSSTIQTTNISHSIIDFEYSSTLM